MLKFIRRKLSAGLRWLGGKPPFPSALFPPERKNYTQEVLRFVRENPGFHVVTARTEKERFWFMEAAVEEGLEVVHPLPAQCGLALRNFLEAEPTGETRILLMPLQLVNTGIRFPQDVYLSCLSEITHEPSLVQFRYRLHNGGYFVNGEVTPRGRNSEES